MTNGILVSKTRGVWQYTMTKDKMIFPASFINSKGEAIEQDVMINAYGITVVFQEGFRKETYDSGPLTAHNHQVNSLFHQLCGMDLNNLEEIRAVIWTAHTEWSKNHFRNCFSRIAVQQLKKELRRNRS